MSCWWTIPLFGVRLPMKLFKWHGRREPAKFSLAVLHHPFGIQTFTGLIFPPSTNSLPTNEEMRTLPKRLAVIGLCKCCTTATTVMLGAESRSRCFHPFHMFHSYQDLDDLEKAVSDASSADLKIEGEPKTPSVGVVDSAISHLNSFLFLRF